MHSYLGCVLARSHVSCCALHFIRLGLAIGFAGALPLSAQTIVPNANLDMQLSPWQAYASTAPDPVGSGAAPVWVASPDLNGNSASGSARVDLNANGAAENAASGMGQCVDFASTTLVHFINYGMSFNVPATTADDGSASATVELRLFASPGCNDFISGGTQGQAIFPGMASASGWRMLGDNHFVPAGAPLNAASAEIRGYLRRTGAASSQASIPVHLDHFVLVLNDTTPVELMQFSVE